MRFFSWWLLASSALLSAAYECDFETCYFSNDFESELKWEKGTGPTQTDDTGPDGDHTTGSGNYWYMDASRASNRAVGRTYSPQLLLGTMGQCSHISFYYYMYGADVEALHFFLVFEPQPFNLDNLLWSMYGDQRKGWKHYEVNVSFPMDFRVLFEAAAARVPFDNKGDIAIDDVSVITGQCEYKACDSQVLWCYNGGTCEPVAESSQGYTCHCADGWEGKNCLQDIDECLPDPCVHGNCTHGTNSYECDCDLGYHGNDCEFVDLCISDEVHRCQHGGTCVPVDDDFSCICTAGYTGNICEVDIDDCEAIPCLHDGQCTDLVNDYSCNCTHGWVGTSCELTVGGCNFDGGLDVCQYNTALPGDFLWQTRSGPTPNFGTGPSEDHTTGSGFYAFTDASSQASGDIALFYSPMFPSSSTAACTQLRFWYYMSGNTIGTLNVFASGTGVPHLEANPIWSRSGEQADNWIEAVANISSPAPYSIIFESIATTVLLSYRGDIAIDDVTVTPGACDYEYCFSNPCKNGGTCIEDEVDDFVCLCTDQWDGHTCEQDVDQCISNPCQNGGTCNEGYQSYTCTCDVHYVGLYCEYFQGSCDFEDADDPVCSYMDDITGDFFWERWSGNTPSAATGPDGDHTTGSGFYLYAEATDRVAGDTGRAMSPVVTGSGMKCTELSFWYFMYGASVGQLALHIKFDDRPLATPVWSMEGQQARNEWIFVDFNISVPEDFQLVFEVIMESKSLIDQDNRGDIAIDDIFVEPNGNCDYEACFQQPCKNGGTCVAENNDYRCECSVDWSGPTCESYQQCLPNPCLNQGQCVIGGDGNFECLCTVGWMGPTCSEVDYCATSPCLNGATCVSAPDRFLCDCVNGYTGDVCSTNINDCDPDPCLNGGTCQDRIGFYECQCPEPYSGDICEKMPSSCDFEGNVLCGWSIDPKSDFNWMMDSGAGSFWPLTGPRIDHTLQSAAGHYLYTPVAEDQPPASSLYRITTEMFSVEEFGNQFNFEFYYHMYGSGIGTLSAYLQEQDGPENVLFLKTGQQVNDWVYFETTFYPTKDWRLVFEHNTVDSALDLGNIALDDVVVSKAGPMSTTTPGTTQQVTTTTGVTTMPPSSTLPTTTTPQTSQITTNPTSRTTAAVVVTTSTNSPTTMATSMTTNNVTEDGKPPGGNGSSGGVIAGAVIGAIVGAVLIAGLAYWFIVEKNKPQPEKQLLQQGIDPSEFAVRGVTNGDSDL